MSITNPQAIAFVNQNIRPRAEQIRALKAQIDADLTQWYAGMSALIPNDSSAVEDGREAEGVSRLVGSDVVNVLSQLVALQSQLDGSGVAATISKPCVRTLQVV